MTSNSIGDQAQDVNRHLIQELPNLIQPTRNDVQLLFKSDIRTIQGHIASTIRPTWQVGPPDNFGQAAHGKLKADEWRSCIEFELPVSLAQIWSDEDGGEDITQRRKKLLDSTMYLAMVIRWATSHQITQEHVEHYMVYMHAYLKAIADCFRRRD
jgi:hypothetical protein